MNVIAGDATIDQLYNLGLVKSPSDFYMLTESDLLTMEGWKEKSVRRFLKSLQESRKVTFDHVLFALGIRHVGESTAKSLATRFGNIDSMIAASREELLEVDDIGEVIADSITEFFRNEANIQMVNNLKNAGLQFEMNGIPSVHSSDILKGKSNFSISRNEMKELIESNGGKNSGSLSGKTSFLLAGEKAGPEKLKKAESSGIPVISESDFMKMISGNSQSGHEPVNNYESSDENHQLSLF